MGSLSCRVIHPPSCRVPRAVPAPIPFSQVEKQPRKLKSPSMTHPSSCGVCSVSTVQIGYYFLHSKVAFTSASAKCFCCKKNLNRYNLKLFFQKQLLSYNTISSTLWTLLLALLFSKQVEIEIYFTHFQGRQKKGDMLHGCFNQICYNFFLTNNRL